MVRHVSFTNSQILQDVSNITLGFVSWRDAQPQTWSLIGFQTRLGEWLSVTVPRSWCETHTFSGHSHCRSSWIMGHARRSLEEPLWVGFQAPQISHPPTCAYLNQISQSCFVSIQLFSSFPGTNMWASNWHITKKKKKNPYKTHSDKASRLPLAVPNADNNKHDLSIASAVV